MGGALLRSASLPGSEGGSGGSGTWHHHSPEDERTEPACTSTELPMTMRLIRTRLPHRPARMIRLLLHTIWITGQRCSRYQWAPIALLSKSI